MSDLQPCSPCREGNHDTCEATGNPYCGCRQEGHGGALAGPVVAPISEVLDAGTRAPAPVMAEVAASPSPALGPVEGAPVAPLPIADTTPLVDQVMGQLGTVLGVPPATLGERTVELDDLTPDDADPDEVPLPVVPDRGQAGLPAQPGPPPVPPAPEAPEGLPPEPSGASPSATSIPMAAERDPDIYVSVWDSHQAHLAEPSTNEAPEPAPSAPAAPSVDSSPTGALRCLVPGCTLTREDCKAHAGIEHAYAGTPAEPYLCSCGADPGSLNKLGSHLGITGNDEALADLAAMVVPNKMAHAAAATLPDGVNSSPEPQPAGSDTNGLGPAEPELDGSQGNVPVIEGLNDERAADILAILVSHGVTYVIEWGDEGTTVKLTLGDREAGPYAVEELPEALPLLTFLNGYDTTLGELEELPSLTHLDGYDATVEALEALPENVTITGDLVGAIEQAMTGADLAQALEELPEPTTDVVTVPTPDEHPLDHDLIDAEDADVRGMATVADAVRDRLASQPATAELLDSGTPWRLVLVNGDTGLVWEALYDDDRLPTALADSVLEHFGFAPSPLDADHPPVPDRTPPPPVPTPATAGTGMAGLPGLDTNRPVRTQVARIQTECARCHLPVEPGEVIGLFPGAGWCHLTHQ